MANGMKALLVLLMLILFLPGCYLRADLSGKGNLQEEPTTTTTSRTPVPEGNDAMAQRAWEIYQKALKEEETFISYELYYEGRQTVMGQTAVTKARVARTAKENVLDQLLVEVTAGEERRSGYYKDGVGYFYKDGKKYWLPTTEDTFFEEMGFSSSAILTEEMFQGAIVVTNEEGITTVSCPLSHPYAIEYANRYLNTTVSAGQVSRVEVGVKVNKDGKPISFTTLVSVTGSPYGEMTFESVNEYRVIGETVQITAPDLHEYVAPVI